MEIMNKEGLTLRNYQTHSVYKQEIFRKLFNEQESNYPWAFNKEYIEMYKENYSDKEHKNTLDVIDSSFAIGGYGAAPNYFLNSEIIDLYIKGFEKLKENIDEVISYYNTKDDYKSPYEGIAKLSDTKGEFK